MTELLVNGVRRSIAAAPDTPLLYALRNDCALNGAKFGCGMAQCGACTVLVDGAPVRSCVTPIVAVAGRPISTGEGLAKEDALGAWAAENGEAKKAKNERIF